MGEAKRKEQSKEEAFKENPDMFMNLKELVIGVQLKDETDGKMTPGFLFNPGATRSLMISAMYDLNNKFKIYIASMDAQSEQAKEGKIITGGNGGVNRLGHAEH